MYPPCRQVIGLLGGTWNPDTRQLVVIEAYACRRAEGSDAATSVELDPAAQVEVQQIMEAKGQRCVGWWVQPCAWVEGRREGGVDTHQCKMVANAVTGGAGCLVRFPTRIGPGGQVGSGLGRGLWEAVGRCWRRFVDVRSTGP